MLSRKTDLEKEASRVIEDYDSCLGFVRYGSDLGNDIDLWAIFHRKPPSSIQDEIRKKLSNSSEFEIHLFFVTEKDLRNGKISIVKGARPIEHFLSKGIDHHQEDMALNDFSLLAVFIYSSMRPFASKQDNLYVNTSKIQSALNNIKLSRQAAIDWIHFYTACFLDEYFKLGGYQKHESIYAKRLAKFVIRISLGYFLSSIEKSKVQILKKSLVKYIQKDKNTLDANIYDFLKEKGGAFFTKDNFQLLNKAKRFRVGHNIKDTKSFISRAENLLFYLAFQHGIDSRQKVEGFWDTLSRYAMDHLTRDFLTSRKAIKKTFMHGETFIKQGQKEDWLFYIPLLKRDKNRKLVFNGSARVTCKDSDNKVLYLRTRGPGRIVGEACLFKMARTASVKAWGKIDLFEISGEKFRQWLTSEGIRNELKHKVLKSDRAKLLDIMLKYLAYESCFFLRDLIEHRIYSYNFDETYDILNPLVTYYLKNRFLNALKNFKLQKIDNKRLLKIIESYKEKVLFDKGDPINNKFFVVAEGFVIIEGIIASAKRKIKLGKGTVFGEASLIGAKSRSAKAVLKAGSKLFEIDASLFKKFTNSRVLIPGTTLLSVELLYHIAAVNFGRVGRRVERLL